jgi:catechol 2,3-dioxygenase-like lactoylglutathione lyase family enzyme
MQNTPNSIPPIGGILETALYAGDPQITAAFYRHLFGFTTLLDTPRLIALNVANSSVLLIFQRGGTTQPVPAPPGGSGFIPTHDGSGSTHFAFAIAAADFNPWENRLKQQNIAIESIVTWPAGAKSLYFRDPDNHLVELITPGFWSIY